MSGVNKVILIGRLGNDPEMKNVKGKAVARLSIATSKEWKDQQGQKQEQVQWHRVTAWDKLADVCGKYLTKGRQVYVEGELKTSSYEKDGQKHYATEIVANTVQFLGSGPTATGTGTDASPALDSSGFDDSIPF